MDDLISRQAAIDAVEFGITYAKAINKSTGEVKELFKEGNKALNDAVERIKDLPSAQPETHEERTETHACDCIERQAVYNVLDKMPVRGFKKDGETIHGLISLSQVNSAIINLPSAQPEPCKDVVKREDVQSIAEKSDWFESSDSFNDFMWALYELPSAQPEQTNSWYINSWCIDCKEYDTENKCCPRYNRVIKQTLDDAYRHGETEAESRYHAQQRWIPCSERLPKEDVEVLISYRYKEGEGDTSHTYIDITTYGQMYFGGNKVGNYKHWRAPFEYFESNYEVIAWMPLPEPYREDGKADADVES